MNIVCLFFIFENILNVSVKIIWTVGKVSAKK